MNPYHILNVKEDVDETTLRRRYKQVCRMFHPDKHENDSTAVALFQIIKEAYEKIKFTRTNVSIDEVVEKDDKRQGAKKRKEKKDNDHVVIPGTNITENDIRVLSTLRADPWFHPNFDLTSYFGSECDPALTCKQQKKKKACE